MVKAKKQTEEFIQPEINLGLVGQ